MIEKTQRGFTLGSEWIYYKLYTGHKTADYILTQIILPITSELLERGIIQEWFFIRYADPKSHLRLRLRTSNIKNLSAIIAAFHEPFNQLLQNDLIWKIQLDTYQRELERYGWNTMVLSETLFYHDSKTIVQFLNLIEGEEGEKFRWLFGLRAINELLNLFRYQPSDKLNIMDRLKTGFGKEFGMSRPLKKQLDHKYRDYREDIYQFLSFTEKEEPDYLPILEVLQKRKNTIEPIAKKIVDLRKKGALQMELDDLISSYIHMLMNRLFKSKNRLNEMVCYDFLFRHLRSEVARGKAKIFPEKSKAS